MGQRDIEQQDATAAFLPTLVPWGYDHNIGVAPGALAGNDATPSRGSANPLKNRERVKGITMNFLKKKKHSRRPWEAQVASVVGPIRSSSFCSLSFHLVLRICWSLQVTARLLTKDDKTGGRDFYRTALSQLAWPRPGPRRTHHLANSPHQQKDNRESAVIRFNGWLWWIGRSK